MLTRSGVHAIQALVTLAGLEPGSFRGTSEIAAATGAPANYLGKLLLLLSRRGLVESRKGLGGGFRLARRADQITLREVVESIENTVRWKECAFGGKSCESISPCTIHERWIHVRDAYLSFLFNTTIADLELTGLATKEPAIADMNAASLVCSSSQRRPQ